MDTMHKTTQAQRRATAKYAKEKKDRIEVQVPKGMKLEIQSYAEYRGVSVNALINELLQKEMRTR
jgi:predicted HicB family RNase H-like nuclease